MVRAKCEPINSEIFNKMASGERKATVWEIKKRLHQLTHDELISLVEHLEPTADTGKCRLDVTYEECCFEYVVDYMTSESLLELEDGGFSQLLLLKDSVDALIQKRNVKTLCMTLSYLHHSNL